MEDGLDIVIGLAGDVEVVAGRLEEGEEEKEDDSWGDMGKAVPVNLQRAYRSGDGVAEDQHVRVFGATGSGVICIWPRYAKCAGVLLASSQIGHDMRK